MKRTHNIQKRLLFFGVFVGLQLFFLFQYWIHVDFIKNFKLSYVSNVYIPITQYKLSHVLKRVDVLSSQSPEENAIAVPVLLYHSIIESPDGANVVLQNFVSQMFALKKAGYTAISLNDFYAFTKGEKKLPKRSILITFDDGPKTSYYPVDPVLQALNYSAVSFIISRYSIGKGSRYYLSSAEINRMIQSGRWEPQLHTKYGHDIYRLAKEGTYGRYYPNKLWRNEDDRLETDAEYELRIQSELREAKKDFENEFNIPSISFAFPFGDYGQNATNYADAKTVLLRNIQAVFPLAFYQIYKGGGYTFNYPAESPFMRKRIIVQPNWDGEDLIRALDEGTPKELPFKDSFLLNVGWSSTWGKQVYTDKGMLLETDNSDGGSIFLDGTYAWKDYHVDVDAIWDQGSSLSVLSRYKDNDTFLACVLSDDGLTFIESNQGKETEIAHQYRYTPLTKDMPIHLEIEMSGSTVTCGTDKSLQVHVADLNPIFSSGGIGFKNWSDTINESRVYITNVSVQPLP